MKNRTYLTSELINFIQQKAMDPIWKMGILAAVTRNWYDIRVVSPMGLIHFEGNSDTGWKHISDRHGFYSSTNYFGFDKIGNPSKFAKDSRPIYDYVNVADDIFRRGVKDIKRHKKSALFEKYKGQSTRYTGSDGTHRDFCLVLYKGTRIVHSLYPENDLEIDRPKRILEEFARCKDKLTFTENLIDDNITISIPYENKANIIRYVVIFRLYEYTMLCKVYLQVNYYNGFPLLTIFPELTSFKANLDLSTRMLYGNINFTRFVNGLALADLSDIERQILIFEEYLKTKLIPRK